MNKKIRSKQLDDLFRAILSLKTIDECYRFFEDIGTISEIQAFSQRFEVARMLKEGYKYTEIAQATGASTATISRVSKSLNYGADGYNIVIERLKKEND
ncbi:MAG TPA: YerC/YecD family TrpR-related protein [Clostridia bacterium]|nr:TrpR YerC/YecD [Clostridiaceae bacterium]HHT91896.1 TrpR YerC/YecD [Clostridiaceae bacterium]HPZ53422.1 YerC/YecD family TrpR-related protein [Clostridia bacterium]